MRARGLIIEGDRLVGLRFRRTRIEGSRVVRTDETFERRGCIGDLVDRIDPRADRGRADAGRALRLEDWELGRLADYPALFSAGNVVTGKGNIVASRKHARAVGEAMIESFLGLAETAARGEAALGDALRADAKERAEEIADAIAKQPPIAPDALARLRTRVSERQRKVGYAGDYKAWIAERHVPLRRVTRPADSGRSTTFPFRNSTCERSSRRAGLADHHAGADADVAAVVAAAAHADADAGRVARPGPDLGDEVLARHLVRRYGSPHAISTISGVKPTAMSPARIFSCTAGG